MRNGDILLTTCIIGDWFGPMNGEEHNDMDRSLLGRAALLYNDDSRILYNSRWEI